MFYYTKKEDLPYFIFDGEYSFDYKMVVTKNDRYSSSEIEYDTHSIPGRDGEVLVKKGKNNKIIEVEFALDCENKDEFNIYTKMIKKWLKGEFKYKELVFSDDLETIYEAICINKIDIDEVLKNLGMCKLKFSCKPYTKTVFNDTITISDRKKVVYNEYGESPPTIKVYGNGNLNFSINNQQVILKNIEGYVIVDSEEVECYKNDNGKITYCNDKIYSELPILEQGENEITLGDNVEKIEITPNWREDD